MVRMPYSSPSDRLFYMRSCLGGLSDQHDNAGNVPCTNATTSATINMDNVNMPPPTPTTTATHHAANSAMMTTAIATAASRATTTTRTTSIMRTATIMTLFITTIPRKSLTTITSVHCHTNSITCTLLMTTATFVPPPPPFR